MESLIWRRFAQDALTEHYKLTPSFVSCFSFRCFITNSFERKNLFSISAFSSTSGIEGLNQYSISWRKEIFSLQNLKRESSSSQLHKIRKNGKKLHLRSNAYIMIFVFYDQQRPTTLRNSAHCYVAAWME